MQLVEQHVIDKNDARYAPIDAAAFASKNLYNAANYLVRQSFIHQGVYLPYPEVYHQMKSHEGHCYNADVNGSYNILRKVAPDVFAQGSRGCVVHPSPLAV